MNITSFLRWTSESATDVGSYNKPTKSKNGNQRNTQKEKKTGLKTASTTSVPHRNLVQNQPQSDHAKLDWRICVCSILITCLHKCLREVSRFPRTSQTGFHSDNRGLSPSAVWGSPYVHIHVSISCHLQSWWLPFWLGWDRIVNVVFCVIPSWLRMLNTK